ncbi:hypothetical protein [Bosea sp. 117]|uniref:hypothetical protein n=1 Tax=Bosea sp. 117 TaxID=1125973 RepID=UPI0012DDC9AE|nr:hypothetical protein [Bosea sp. 117]
MRGRQSCSLSRNGCPEGAAEIAQLGSRVKAGADSSRGFLRRNAGFIGRRAPPAQ